jgi:small subunit ribosomal protein S2
MTVKDLNTQLSQRDTIIQGQNFQILEQNHQIKNLREEKSELDERLQKIMTGVEEAETREAELGKMLQEKERELKTLQEQALRMRDDLTHIAGIGVKISSVLRSAGIDTFAKLATAKVDSIRKILEAENPSLLRLTDPSAWPEQARIAADGDWEALSNLQNKNKTKRD